MGQRDTGHWARSDTGTSMVMTAESCDGQLPVRNTISLLLTNGNIIYLFIYLRLVDLNYVSILCGIALIVTWYGLR